MYGRGLPSSCLPSPCLLLFRLPPLCLWRSCLCLFCSSSRPIDPRENAKNLGISRRYFDRSGAIFAPPACMRHAAAELLCQQLHTIANAQHRQAAPENGGVAGGRVLIIDARWPTRQNKAFDIQVRVPLQFRQRSRRRYQFAVDVALAHTTSNQPAVLRSKIKNDNCLPALCGLHVLPFKPLTAFGWPTRYIDNLAVDKAGFIRTQEADHIGNVARLANTAYRNALGRFFLHHLRIKPQPACSGARHLGVDVARSDRVHVDAERPKFNG